LQGFSQCFLNFFIHKNNALRMSACHLSETHRKASEVKEGQQPAATHDFLAEPKAAGLAELTGRTGKHVAKRTKFYPQSNAAWLRTERRGASAALEAAGNSPRP
jgi:hypothetical protein